MRLEPDRARSARQVAADCIRLHFGHGAATVADQENNDFIRAVPIITGEERVATLDAVSQSLHQEKIERAIDGHGRRGLPNALQSLHDFIGAERGMAFGEHFEDAAPQRRQPLPGAVTGFLGARKRIRHALRMVVIGLGKS